VPLRPRGWTPAILLTVAALCAFGAVGCGGGDDSSTSTTAESGSGAESTTAGGGEGTKGNGAKGNGFGSSGTGGNSGSGGGSEGSESISPHERSYQFRTPGGDNSIQSFGDEGGGSDRSEATAIVTALFKALESGDWTEVCSTYLSASNIEQLKVLSEKSPQVKGKGCAEVLGSLASSGAPANSPDAPDGDVVSLRIEGEVAFAIYRGRDGKGYAVPLKLEGGKYKLTALAPTPLN
jgi:hypothetical protein